MATAYTKTYKVKYVTNYITMDTHDGVLYNEGKFVVNATSVEDAIEIVKRHAAKILGRGGNVYIIGVKPEV